MRLIATKMMAIARHSALVSNLSVFVNNRSGYLKQLTIAIGKIWKNCDRKINEANEKVIDTPRKWYKIVKQGKRS